MGQGFFGSEVHKERISSTNILSPRSLSLVPELGFKVSALKLVMTVDDNIGGNPFRTHTDEFFGCFLNGETRSPARFQKLIDKSRICIAYD